MPFENGLVTVLAALCYYMVYVPLNFFRVVSEHIFSAYAYTLNVAVVYMLKPVMRVFCKTALKYISFAHPNEPFTANCDTEIFTYDNGFMQYVAVCLLMCTMVLLFALPPTLTYFLHYAWTKARAGPPPAIHPRKPRKRK